jgi:uncharacterized protein
MARVAIFLINLYQKTLSPDHGAFRVWYPNGFCRFHPSCSEYTKQAIQKHGLRGLLMGLKRVLRCNPYSKGGIDQVV